MGDDAVRKVFEEQLAVVGEGLLADPSNQELLQLREEIKVLKEIPLCISK